MVVQENPAAQIRGQPVENKIMDLKLTALFVTLSAIIGLSGYHEQHWQTLQAKLGRWRSRRR